ncbi:MAG: helix-turn-helix transcriptional regulator [Oscillospiraceae bacterium]|nr:helix-turn-helix transcriptional regulator [Oscillospiraceae bacterium]
MFDTIARVKQLAAARGISASELARRAGVNRSTFNSTVRRGTQLKVETIEQICATLHISLAEFFAVCPCGTGENAKKEAMN